LLAFLFENYKINSKKYLNPFTSNAYKNTQILQKNIGYTLVSPILPYFLHGFIIILQKSIPDADWSFRTYWFTYPYFNFWDLKGFQKRGQ